jgi:hypothetical protein
VRIRQVRDTDAPVESAIAPPQMPADPPLRCFRVRVIAVVEHHQLDVAEDPLDGIIIGTAFGQRDPMQFQLPHHMACPA